MECEEYGMLTQQRPPRSKIFIIFVVKFNDSLEIIKKWFMIATAFWVRFASEFSGA